MSRLGNQMIEQAQAAARRAFAAQMNNPGCGVLVSLHEPIEEGHQQPTVQELCAAHEAFGRELDRLYAELN